MNSKQRTLWFSQLFKIFFIVCMITTALHITAAAQQDNRYIRIADITVDSAYLDNYKTALKEHTETAVKVEPGVLMLYSVYYKEQPTHVTVFEIYADKSAYEAHIQTAHFKKYKTTVEKMVKSLKLSDVSPIAMETKLK